MQLISGIEPTGIALDERSSEYNSIRSKSDEIATYNNMKELPVVENVCIPPKESHIQNNGQLKIKSTGVGASALLNCEDVIDKTSTKKISENLDSPSLSSNNSSWTPSVAGLDSVSEKDVTSNGILYDPISDDESMMLHLSDDDAENSASKDKTYGESSGACLKNGLISDLKQAELKKCKNKNEDTKNSSSSDTTNEAEIALPEKTDSIQEDHTMAGEDSSEPLSSSSDGHKDEFVSNDRSDVGDEEEKANIPVISSNAAESCDSDSLHESVVDISQQEMNSTVNEGAIDAHSSTNASCPQDLDTDPELNQDTCISDSLNSNVDSSSSLDTCSAKNPCLLLQSEIASSRDDEARTLVPGAVSEDNGSETVESETTVEESSELHRTVQDKPSSEVQDNSMLGAINSEEDIISLSRSGSTIVELSEIVGNEDLTSNEYSSSVNEEGLAQSSQENEIIVKNTSVIAELGNTEEAKETGKDVLEELIERDCDSDQVNEIVPMEESTFSVDKSNGMEGNPPLEIEKSDETITEGGDSEKATCLQSETEVAFEKTENVPISDINVSKEDSTVEKPDSVANNLTESLGTSSCEGEKSESFCLNNIGNENVPPENCASDLKGACTSPEGHNACQEENVETVPGINLEMTDLPSAASEAEVNDDICNISLQNNSDNGNRTEFGDNNISMETSDIDLEKLSNDKKKTKNLVTGKENTSLELNVENIVDDEDGEESGDLVKVHNTGDSSRDSELDNNLEDKEELPEVTAQIMEDSSNEDAQEEVSNENSSTNLDKKTFDDANCVSTDEPISEEESVLPEIDQVQESNRADEIKDKTCEESDNGDLLENSNQVSVDEENVKNLSDQTVMSLRGNGQLSSGADNSLDAEPKPRRNEERWRRKRASIQEEKPRVSKRTRVAKSKSIDSVSDKSDNDSAKQDREGSTTKEATEGTVNGSTKVTAPSVPKRSLEPQSGRLSVKKVRIMSEVEKKLSTNEQKNAVSVSVSEISSDADKVEVQPEEPSPRKELSNLDKAIERVVAGTTESVDSPPKKLNPMPFMRQLHLSQLKKLTRNDLEELVVQKLCEVVTERCQVGELRQRVQTLENMLEQWRKKAMQLSKQVKDMEMVVRKFTSDQRLKKDRLVIPVKITRSVGLQVGLGQSTSLGQLKNRLSDGSGNREGNSNTHMRRRISRNVVPLVSSSQPTQTSRVQTQSPITVQKVVPPTYQKIAPSPNGSVSSTAPSASVRQNTSSFANMPNAGVKSTQNSIKTIPSRSPVTTSNSGTTNSLASMNSNLTARLTSPTVTNRTIRPIGSHPTAGAITVKSTQDLKVIDLTDEEDKTRTSLARNTTVGSTILTPTTTSIVPANAMLPNANVSGRGIRVVQPHQLSGATTAILTPTNANTAAAQRVAYLVPSAVGAGQQRQLLIATSTPQVRPGGVMSGGIMSGGMMSVTNRPAIVFKSGAVLPMSQGTGSPTCTTTILRTTPAMTGSPLQQVLTSQRPGQPIRVSPSVMPMSRAPPVSSLASVPVPVPPAPPPIAMHPAPLPSSQPFAGPINMNWKLAPPKPDLKISKVVNKNQQGIVLSWNMQLSPEYEEVASYQLFAYQEGNAAPSTMLWKKVGDVKALPLPMACTLTQFMEGHKYHFAVRAVDVHTRCGPFSLPGNIVLTRK